METRGTDHRFVIISYCWCLILFLAPASRKLTGSYYHSPIINGSKLKIEKGTWGAQRSDCAVRVPPSVENSYWNGLPPKAGSRFVRNEIAPLHWHRYERILSECTRRCSHRSVPFGRACAEYRFRTFASRRPSPPSTQRTPLAGRRSWCVPRAGSIPNK